MFYTVFLSTIVKSLIDALFFSTTRVRSARIKLECGLFPLISSRYIDVVLAILSDIAALFNLNWRWDRYGSSWSRLQYNRERCFAPALLCYNCICPLGCCLCSGRRSVLSLSSRFWTLWRDCDGVFSLVKLMTCSASLRWISTVLESLEKVVAIVA